MEELINNKVLLIVDKGLFCNAITVERSVFT